MASVTLAVHAMATRFEILLHGENAVLLRAAGEEALQEIERLEAQLSLFRPSSEIAHLNARAAGEPVRVTPGLFALLQHARKLYAETGGAFDISIAPLVRAWGFMGESGRVPDKEELAETRARVGMHLVELNARDLTVHFARPGVMLDLGAIGKGYAVQRAADLLREEGVTSALLHGGTSTVYALGHPPDAERWQVAVDYPRGRPEPEGAADTSRSALVRERQDAEPVPFATIPLRDEALSVSAIWGKYFKLAGRTLGHIIDPRSGQPAGAAVLSAVVLPSATETDALSTALLTGGLAEYERISQLRAGMRTLLVAETEGHFEVRSSGISFRPLEQDSGT